VPYIEINALYYLSNHCIVIRQEVINNMDYSKSYMFFGVVLFVIFYSQVLTAIHVHDESPVTGESCLAYNLFLQVKCK
jgi:hypothetical protein